MPVPPGGGLPWRTICCLGSACVPGRCTHCSWSPLVSAIADSLTRWQALPLWPLAQVRCTARLFTATLTLIDCSCRAVSQHGTQLPAASALTGSVRCTTWPHSTLACGKAEPRLWASTG